MKLSQEEEVLLDEISDKYNELPIEQRKQIRLYENYAKCMVLFQLSNLMKNDLTPNAQSKIREWFNSFVDFIKKDM